MKQEDINKAKELSSRVKNLFPNSVPKKAVYVAPKKDLSFIKKFTGTVKPVEQKPDKLVGEYILKQKHVDTPEEIVGKINSSSRKIDASVIDGVPEASDIVDSVIKELKNKQHLEPKDIKGMPINMNDMRWHGGGSGGLTAVSHDETLTGDGTPSSPLSAIAGGTGTVTSVSALTIGTTGTDLSSTVATGTTTPVITLQVPTASATNRGALSSTDWSTFNGKQNALTNPITGTGTINELPYWATSSTLGTLAVATYPSLTELSYVKGVTSGIQSQLNGKQASGSYQPLATVLTNTTASYTTTIDTRLANTSNTNTGDNSANSLYSGLTTSKADVGQTMYVGTTQIAINRASAALTLAGITLTTPDIGVATATSINGATITSGTLNGSVTGTNTGDNATNSTYTTLATTIATANSWTATQTFRATVNSNNAITASGNAATVPITYKLNTVTNNSAATLTITMTTTSAVDGQMTIVRILDASGVAQTIAWVNTENSTVSAPTTSNGSTTLFRTVGFIYNGSTSKWRCIADA